MEQDKINSDEERKIRSTISKEKAAHKATLVRQLTAVLVKFDKISDEDKNNAFKLISEIYADHLLKVESRRLDFEDQFGDDPLMMHLKDTQTKEKEIQDSLRCVAARGRFMKSKGY